MVDSTDDARTRFTYVHQKRPLDEALDAHHIVVRRNAAKGFIFYLSNLLLIANPFILFIVKDRLVIILLWGLLLGAFLVKLLFRKPVEKESVIIMPAFGVQLETHYGSGRAIRRFVPMGKILKAVLNECVTPVTCYWTLSLIVSEEEQLTLVFKELRPPVRVLVPIWRALCKAIEGEETCGELQKTE